MKNAKFLLGILVMGLVFGMAYIGCDNGTSSSSGNDGSLDGTWNNATMTIIISGTTYTAKESGVNWGKGNVSYGGSSFTLNSTHAWYEDGNLSFWMPYVEKITGNYSLSGTKLTITNVTGDYSIFNGTWTKQ